MWWSKYEVCVGNGNWMCLCLSVWDSQIQHAEILQFVAASERCHSISHLVKLPEKYSVKSRTYHLCVCVVLQLQHSTTDHDRVCGYVTVILFYQGCCVSLFFCLFVLWRQFDYMYASKHDCNKLRIRFLNNPFISMKAADSVYTHKVSVHFFPGCSSHMACHCWASAFVPLSMNSCWWLLNALCAGLNASNFHNWFVIDVCGIKSFMILWLQMWHSAILHILNNWILFPSRSATPTLPHSAALFLGPQVESVLKVILKNMASAILDVCNMWCV